MKKLLSILFVLFSVVSYSQPFPAMFMAQAVPTPFEINTAIYKNVISDAITTWDNSCEGLEISPDGTRAWTVSTNLDSVYQADLSTPYDVSTLTYTGGDSYKISVVGFGIGQDIKWGDSGDDFYILDVDNDRIYQFDVSVAYDITSTVTYLDFLDINTQTPTPKGFDILYTGSAYYLYTINAGATQEIVQYTLSSWDITTGSYTNEYAISTSVTQDAEAIKIGNSGTWIGICDDSGDKIIQFSMGTAYNITTTSYNSRKNINAQTGFPRGITIKSDGTLMWIYDAGTDGIIEYLMD